MKKIILLIFLISLAGCVSTIEPTSQKNNPAKVNSDIKIIYSSPDEIFIMHNLNPLKLGLEMSPVYIKPQKEYIETAFNHCSTYKKNTYFLFKRVLLSGQIKAY